MRRRAFLVAAVLVVVVGLGLAAGAVETGTFDTGDGQISPPPAPDGAAGGTSGDLWLVLGYWLLVAFALFGLWMAVRAGEGTPTQVAIVGAALLVAGLLVYALVEIGGYAPIPPELISLVDGWLDLPSVSTGSETQPDVASGETPGAGDASPLGVAAVLGGVVGAGVAAVAWALFATRSSDAPPSDSGADEAGADPDAVAQAAGRAAATLADDAAANPVYSAWHEMTSALAVTDPETTTPAEFAEVAIAAGFDSSDVHALTDVFREVRYGAASVSDDRIAVAREALRRLEASGGSGPRSAAGPGGEQP